MCLRCLARGQHDPSTTVIRVGGGYLILSADGCVIYILNCVRNDLIIMIFIIMIIVIIIVII